MNDPRNHSPRRVPGISLTAAGILAAPWGLVPARAAVPGRAGIGFQMPPDQNRFKKRSLDGLHKRDRRGFGSTPVIIPGAAGGVAIETVAHADPDGGTCLIAPSLVPIIMKRPVDPADTLIPVAGICECVPAFSVGPAGAARVLAMADDVEWVCANPRPNSYGVRGLGAATHHVGAEVSRLAAPMSRGRSVRRSSAACGRHAGRVVDQAPNRPFAECAK